MSVLSGRRVLLGVGGGIAAYKAPMVVRALRAAGAEVRVVLTRSAREFVTPMALQAVSGNRVGSDLFDPAYEHEIGHIEMARWADAILVAPATANLISRMRVGAADDLLTTVLLATRAPVVVAPAMNSQMLAHPAVQENLEVLAQRGVTVVPPDSGELACSEVGPGRQPDPPVLVSYVDRVLRSSILRGRSVVVTAGPTREYFDPVRFLSNPSSGRMGCALAESAFAEGAEVTLIHGPLSVDVPAGVTAVPVTTAEQMCEAVLAAADCDVLFMSAAVADWTPETVSETKRKKGEGAWAPTMARTRDVLAALASNATRPKVTVGFAAETNDVDANARDKRQRKGLDGIVANDVSGGKVFGAERTTVRLINAEGATSLGPDTKRAVADGIVRWASGMLGGRS